MASVGNPVSGNWPVANLALFLPVVIPYPYTVSRVFWGNGSSIAGGNADFGMYSSDGTQLFHTGSTALSGTSSIQYASLTTPYRLSPGRYFFALANDGTTSRSLVATTGLTTSVCRQAGFIQQSNAMPLPATLVPEAMANAFIPIFGITRTASGF